MLSIAGAVASVVVIVVLCCAVDDNALGSLWSCLNGDGFEQPITM
jgi:hypothetical protein